MPGIDFSAHAVNPAVMGPAPVAPKAAGSDSHFGFDDLLDIVNPLQHFPVVSTLYKHLTGDQIGVPEKIMGDTLYGGMLGLISSVGDAIFTEVTGKSVGDTVYAYLFGEDQPTTAVASADQKPAEAVASSDQSPASTQTVAAQEPIDVKPASSEDIALPHFGFLDSFADEMPSAEVAQRAANAYRATTKFLSF